MPDGVAPEVERVSYYLRNIFRYLDRDTSFLLSQEGLTFAQMIVLRHIKKQGESTLAELTDSLGWAASTLSGIVKRLERDGFLQRLTDPSDLRVHRLTVTDKTHHILATTGMAYYQHLSRILSHFSPDQLEALTADLDHLWDAVQKERPKR